MAENGNGDSQISVRECNFKGFLKRAAYNLSGRRSIGYILGVSGILLILIFHKLFPTVGISLVEKGMSSVETMALAFLAVQGIPTVVDALKGKGRGDK